MADVLETITTPPAVIEVRLESLTIRNHLDAIGAPGTPGKYAVTLRTVGEQQTADRDAVLIDGAPVRTARPPITFDPMDYLSVQFTRDDGSTFSLGAIFADLITAIDALKGGLPAA